jgi:hypothetical protein
MMTQKTATLLALGLTFLLHAAPAEAQRRPSYPTLRGSRAALARENAWADRHDLTRIRDLAELRRFIAAGLLVPVASSDAYVIDATLGEEDPDDAALYAHARPWTLAFLDDLLVEGHRLHGDRYEITSLVRTQAYQRTLRRHNAAAASGRTRRERSSHLTGATVDIRTEGLSADGHRWLRERLVELERLGAVLATEERYNGCFHIMVSPDYERRARRRARTADH